MITTLLVILGLVALVLIAAALKPADFRVTRHAVISAPPAAVFAHVNEFRQWLGWSPWEKVDPALKRTYEGPSAGIGAVYSWEGDKNVGSGRMTILESRPGELIRIKLEFFKPMALSMPWIGNGM